MQPQIQYNHAYIKYMRTFFMKVKFKIKKYFKKINEKFQ